MSVFEEHDRNDVGPARYTDSPFDWLDRSARPEAAEARDRVDAMYADFPDDSGSIGNCLRIGSQQDADNVFYGALGSLYVYQRLGLACKTVRVDEAVAGNERRPDLQVLAEDGAVDFTVEVTALCEKGDWAQSDWYLAQLVDALNDGLARESFDLGVLPDGLWDHPVPSDELIEGVKRRMAELPSPEEVASTYEKVGSLPSFRFEIDGLAGEIEFIPLHEAKVRARPESQRGRIVAMTQSAGGTVNATTRIRRKLGRKHPKRYPEGLQTTDKPYVVALTNVDHYADLENLVDALFGAPIVVVNKHEPHVFQERRDAEGYFTPDEDGRANAEVSGVLFIDHFGSSYVMPERPTVYFVENPFAKNPIEPSLMNAEYRLLRATDGHMVWDPPLPAGASDNP